MKIARSGDTLYVSHINELATATANSFESALSAAMPPGVKRIDLDLSQTGFVDCAGLGTLIGFRKRARSRNHDVTIRLVNPPQPVQRMVSLLRMDAALPTAPPIQPEY